jgi:Ca2+-binding RTX toxin-like protein
VIALLGYEGLRRPGGDTFIGIENLTSSIYADILWGDDGVSAHGHGRRGRVARPRRERHVDGGAGADRMLGGPGGDTYYVDNGADEIESATRARPGLTS